MGKVYIVFIERVCVLLLTPPSTRLASWSFHEGLAEAWLVGGCGVDVCGLCVVVCVYGWGCVFAYVRTCQCVRLCDCVCMRACFCVLQPSVIVCMQACLNIHALKPKTNRRIVCERANSASTRLLGE